MKKLGFISVVFLLSCILQAGCDYAKPTDVEAVDDKVEALRQQLNQQEEDLQEQLNQQEEDLQEQLSSWEIVFALIGANFSDMGQVRSESPTHGVLTTNEVHVYQFNQDENREVTIVLEGSGDVVFSLLREMNDGSFDNLGRFDQDLDSTYRSGWDASIFKGTLEAGAYLIVVEAYSFEEELQYRISFAFP